MPPMNIRQKIIERAKKNFCRFLSTNAWKTDKFAFCRQMKKPDKMLIPSPNVSYKVVRKSFFGCWDHGASKNSLTWVNLASRTLWVVGYELSGCANCRGLAVGQPLESSAAAWLDAVVQYAFLLQSFMIYRKAVTLLLTFLTKMIEDFNEVFIMSN